MKNNVCKIKDGLLFVAGFYVTYGNFPSLVGGCSAMKPNIYTMYRVVTNSKWGFVAVGILKNQREERKKRNTAECAVAVTVSDYAVAG